MHGTITKIESLIDGITSVLHTAWHEPRGTTDPQAMASVAATIESLVNARHVLLADAQPTTDDLAGFGG